VIAHDRGKPQEQCFVGFQTYTDIKLDVAFHPCLCAVVIMDHITVNHLVSWWGTIKTFLGLFNCICHIHSLVISIYLVCAVNKFTCHFEI